MKYYEIELISCSVMSFITFYLFGIDFTFLSSLGIMDAEWNAFSENMQSVIQNQLAVRFGEGTPQGNLFMLNIT